MYSRGAYAEGLENMDRQTYVHPVVKSLGLRQMGSGVRGNAVFGS